MFVVSFLSPALIPVVTAMDLSTEMKATLSGLLTVGIPELGAIVAVAIMGKPGYNKMKQRIFAVFKRYGTPKEVSLLRYRIGLLMFVVPILFAWLQPYVEHFTAFYGTRGILWAGSGDLVFILSFFVLGGDFWDKVQALFLYGARVVRPESPAGEKAVWIFCWGEST